MVFSGDERTYECSEVRDAAGEETKATSRSNLVRTYCLRVWTGVGLVLLVGVLIYLLRLLSLPVCIVIWTAIIVFCLRSPVNFLERMGVNRAIGTVAAYILMILVLFIIGTLMFSPMFGVGNQFYNLIQSIPSAVEQISAWIESVYPHFEPLIQNELIKEWLNELAKSLGSGVSATAKLSAEALVSLSSAIANSIIIIVFALIVAFWILIELPALGREFRRVIGPKYEEDAMVFYDAITRAMGGYIRAQLIQNFLIGLGSGIAFVVMGIPNSAALGVIVGVVNLVPVAGPWLGAAIAGGAAVFVSPFISVAAMIAAIVVAQFVYIFISPKLMHNSVDVHPSLVFIALLSGSAIGAAVGGVTAGLGGMLAAIPAVAVIKSMFVYYFEKQTGRAIMVSDGVFFKGDPAVNKPGIVHTHAVEDGVADACEENAPKPESNDDAAEQ